MVLAVEVVGLTDQLFLLRHGLPRHILVLTSVHTVLPRTALLRQKVYACLTPVAPAEGEVRVGNPRAESGEWGVSSVPVTSGFPSS